jgi:hypothetical protein
MLVNIFKNGLQAVIIAFSSKEEESAQRQITTDKAFLQNTFFIPKKNR